MARQSVSNVSQQMVRALSYKLASVSPYKEIATASPHYWVRKHCVYLYLMTAVSQQLARVFNNGKR